MLSKYIPPQNLQIELLNKWRNSEKYGSDPFAPGKYSFDYLFAITMAAQPLVWMEATGLPQEAFKTSGVIKTYKKLQNEIHRGTILPIGNEPDGISWTGFQSISGDKGYFIIFRESSPLSKTYIKTWLTPGKKVKCEAVFGNGKSFNALVDVNGNVPFELNSANNFELYKYDVIK